MTSSAEYRAAGCPAPRNDRSPQPAGLVCLVRPPAVETFRLSTGSITLPLGLAYIAAALEAAGIGVHVVDAVALAPRRFTRYNRGYLVGLGFADIVERIPAETTLVGISVIFTHEWPAVSRLVREIKRARPDLRIVLGGEHVTSMPEFCLASSEADWLVLGEGEETIVDLIGAARREDVAGVPGIAYRSGRTIVVTPRRARRRQVDDIARPAWHLLDWKTYNDCGYVGGIDVGEVTFPILATRGCPYQCTFCSSPNMWGTSWIPRDPIKTVDEIEHYVRAYGARNFPFQDLTAIIRRDWIIAFCQEIIRRDLRISWQFPSGTRSEAIDGEVAQLLHRSGMINMGYAPESGSDRTRQLIKKKMTADRMLGSIRDAVAAGLSVNVWIILGFPHDTRESVRENLPFIDRIAELGVTDFGVSLYQALPGTEMFESLCEAGRIRLDRHYFSHVLQGSTILPEVSYCDALGRLALAYWKLRLSLRFYRAKRRRSANSGLISTARRAVHGILGSGPHRSRMETAMRNGWRSAWLTLAVQFRRGWVSRREEKALFDDWDRILAEIRRQNRARGVLPPVPIDTPELHKANVNTRLKVVHSAEHRVSFPAPALAAGRLAILIPTLNEAGTIAAVLDSIPPQYAGAVIVVDGGSTDDTHAIAASRGFRVLRQTGRGLGDAIMCGVRASEAEVFVTLDGDGAHDGSHVVQLLETLQCGYDLVVASRMSNAPADAGTFSRRRRSSEPAGFVRDFGNRLFTALCRGLFGLPLHDVLNGCKAFRREAFFGAGLTRTDQAHDIELVLKAHRAGYRVADVAIQQGPRLAGESKLSAIADGASILGVILREAIARPWKRRAVTHRPFRAASIQPAMRLRGE